MRAAQSVPNAPRKSHRFFSSSFSDSSAAISNAANPGLPPASAVASLNRSVLRKGAKARRHFFPSTSQKVVAYWLLGSAANVFGIVVFGGLTRLTESGYDILEKVDEHCADN